MADTTDVQLHQAHRTARMVPVREVAGLLQELLSRRLTAYIAGVGSGKTVSRRASGEIAAIRWHLSGRPRSAQGAVQVPGL